MNYKLYCDGACSCVVKTKVSAGFMKVNSRLWTDGHLMGGKKTILITFFNLTKKP